MSSKGGSSSSGSNWGVSTTILPDWLNTASQNAINYSAEISKIPYQAYQGDMVSDVPQDTLQAYQQIRDLQGLTEPTTNQSLAAYQGLIGSAAPITTDQLNQNTSALYGQYGQDVLSPAASLYSGAYGNTAGLLGGYLDNAAPATYQDVMRNQMGMMSPYIGLVANPAMRIGQQQLAQNLQTIGAGANQAGAFGGTRQGVQEGVAQSQAALGSEKYIGDLLNSAWQNNLGTSWNLANQASQQGYSAANMLAQQGYGTAGKLADLAGTGYGAAQTQGGSLANTNLQAGLTAAQRAPELAMQQQAQRQKEASMLQTIGAAQQNQQQAEINAAMGQWYEQLSYPYQQLDTLLSAVSGVPYGSQTSSYGQSSSNSSSSKNTASGVLGGAASGAAIGSLIPGVGTAIGAVAGGILGAL